MLYVHEKRFSAIRFDANRLNPPADFATKNLSKMLEQHGILWYTVFIKTLNGHTFWSGITWPRGKTLMAKNNNAKNDADAVAKLVDFNNYNTAKKRHNGGGGAHALTGVYYYNGATRRLSLRGHAVGVNAVRQLFNADAIDGLRLLLVACDGKNDADGVAVHATQHFTTILDDDADAYLRTSTCVKHNRAGDSFGVAVNVLAVDGAPLTLAIRPLATADDDATADA